MKAPDTFCRSPLRWRPVRLFVRGRCVGRSRAWLRLMAGIRPWLCGAQGRGLLIASALEPGRLAPALAGSRWPRRTGCPSSWVHPRTCGEQTHPGSSSSRSPGPPPHVRGTGTGCAVVEAEEGCTPARAGNSLPDLHLHLGKSPFHANFAMSATLASAVRIPPLLPGFPAEHCTHAHPRRRQAGARTPAPRPEPLHPLGCWGWSGSQSARPVSVQVSCPANPEAESRRTPCSSSTGQRSPSGPSGSPRR